METYNEVKKNKTQSEILFEVKSNFDTRKVLNRSSNYTAPQSLIDKIEKDGISIEELDKLPVQIFKYIGQITIHGDYSKLKNERILGYKYLTLNQNKTLGIKYNAVDGRKKATIQVVMNYFRSNDGWAVRTNSTSYSITKMTVVNSQETFTAAIAKYRDELKTIPKTLYIGTAGVRYGSAWGGIIVELYINLNAIYEKNLWEFIGYLSENKISSEAQYNEFVENRAKTQAKANAEYEAQKAIKKAEQEKRFAELKKDFYPKISILPVLKTLPKEGFFCFVRINANQPVLKIIQIQKGSFGRQFIKLKEFDELENIELTEVLEAKSRVLDDSFKKVFDDKLEKGELFGINQQQVQLLKQNIKLEPDNSFIMARAKAKLKLLALKF